MAKTNSSAGLYCGKRTAEVRIVVAGDSGTGKSTLITALITESFDKNVPPVLPETRLPVDFYPDHVPLIIVDTSSSTSKRNNELKRADIVVLTYACNQPTTLARLSTYWLPELRKLEVKVPVIIAGCKLDLIDEEYLEGLKEVISSLTQEFLEIECSLECSAVSNRPQVEEVFKYAQSAVLYPLAPLYDQEKESFNSKCVRALTRIFGIFDRDNDGALSDSELNEFQVKCFNQPLKPEDIRGVKKIVHAKVAGGINDDGITEAGFLFLHGLFVEKGRVDVVWSTLWKFGYGMDLKLEDDVVPLPPKHDPKSEDVEDQGFVLVDIDG